MRFPIRRAGAALASVLVWAGGMVVSAPAAAAPCLGVARTIAVDPARGHFYNGLERSLGLRDGEVVLTFDDGPKPGTTTRILDALRAECTKATFFMAGRMADSYPSVAGRVRREGHTVAGHTHAHENLAKLPSGAVSAAIDKGNASLRRATGQRDVAFFRYPYLAKNARTDAIVRAKGLVAFGTNIDSKDYHKVGPNAVRAKIMGQLRRQRKGIVLMHDIHARTATMLPALLDQLKAEGFKVVHLVPGRGGRPEPDAVLASAAPAEMPASDGPEPRVRVSVPANATERVAPSVPRVLAAFARHGSRERSARRVAALGGQAMRAMTPDERRRARRAVRREFQVATDWRGGDRGAPLLRLEPR